MSEKGFGRLVCGFLLAAAWSSVQAAPQVSGVSGTFSAGQSITVNGSAFGTKENAAPLLWDDFEGGKVGSTVGSSARIGSWDSGMGSNAVSYTSDKARTGSKSAYHNFMNGNYNASLAKNGNFPRLYIDYWIMVDYVDRLSRNWKPWRLYGANDALQMDYVWLCNGSLMNILDSTTGWSTASWGQVSYAKNKWMHIQLIVSASSPSGSDGTVRHFIDSKAEGFNTSATSTRKSSGNYSDIRIGHYWANDGVSDCPANGGAKVYTDNVYIDTSWARVEIGNASTYAASTIREIQVPTAWNNGSVSFNLNPGTFQPGSQVYLYVTDSDNGTSPGFPITLGGSVRRPNPPAGLSVQ